MIKKFLKKLKKKKDDKKITFDSHPDLLRIKPKEKYIFRSDYFEVDDYYACILSYFHDNGAADNFGPFWGINKIPSGLEQGVTTINFDQVRRMSQDWLRDHRNTSEGVANVSGRTANEAGNIEGKQKAQRTNEDLERINQELSDGASYLQIQSRILVKAPTLEMLDDALTHLETLYKERFATLRACAYTGEQRSELSTLFWYNKFKKGKGFHMTSTEYAGAYHLVTHGLEDKKGEYVGYMVGDVNNSAVLFHVDGFDHHVVVANEVQNEKRGRMFVSNMWGSKISQNALLNNKRVVHIVLDNTNLDLLGPKFDALTSKLDMNNGDLNMFEMFGEVEDELSIFPSHMQKLILMAEQAYESTESDRSIIRGSLEEILTQFYIDKKMWSENAKDNRDKIRIVGIPHDQVPRLQLFVTYLDMAYKAMVSTSARDNKKMNAINVLKMTFQNLLSNNGDLFNTFTNSNIDLIGQSRRMIYDFSNLKKRGKGVAMAQLVNVIGFAIDHLDRGDVLIIHGTEHIDKGVKSYIVSQIERLHEKGGRVCYLYNKVEKMLGDSDFNAFDKADYIILGTMSDNVVNEYQRKLGQEIPKDLKVQITKKDDRYCYIRRGFDNVVFAQDIRLE